MSPTLELNIPASFAELLEKFSVDAHVINELVTKSKSLYFKKGDIFTVNKNSGFLTFFDDGLLCEIIEDPLVIKSRPMCWVKGLALMHQPEAKSSSSGIHLRCLSDCTITQVSQEHIVKALSNNTSFLNFWLGMESLNSKHRLHNTLLRSSLQKLDYIKCAIVITFFYFESVGYGNFYAISVTELSEILGCSRQYLSETLSLMEDEGFIKKHHNGIEIRNLSLAVSDIDPEIIKLLLPLHFFPKS